MRIISHSQLLSKILYGIGTKAPPTASQAVGGTINYIISRRIEESKYLLAETDLSMSQIAQLLGFSSLSYFSQVFR